MKRTLVKLWSLLLCLCLLLAGCGGDSTRSNGPDGQPTKSTENSRLLLVSKFGEGTISSSGGTMSCLGQECEDVYEKGTLVTLTAVPADGWSFSHWSGCTTSDGAKCEILMEESTQIYPYFTKTTPVVINSKVIMLSDETMQSFISRDGNVFTFKGGTQQLKSATRGNILISTSGDGFAVRVTNIYFLDGGNIIFDSEQVGLDEIVDDGIIIFKSDGAETQKQSLAKGVKYNAIKSDSSTTSKFVLNIDLGEGTSIEGEVEAIWNFEGGFDFRLGSGLNELKLMSSPVIKPSLKIKLGKKIEKEKLIDLGILKIAPIIAGPIVIVPTVKGYVKVSVDGSAAIDFSSSYELKGSYGTHYVKGRGLSGVGTSKISGNLEPKGNAALEGLFGVGVYSQFLIYDVAGPFVQVGPYIRAKGEFIPVVSGGKSCSKATADLGVYATAGGKLEVFGKSYGEYEGVLFDKILLNIYKYDSSGCEKDGNPSATKLTLSDATASSIKLSYEKSPDSDFSHFELFRDSIKISQTSNSEYIDTNLRPGRTYCYNIITVDLSGSKSIYSNKACLKTKDNDISAPTKPTNLSATTATTTSIDLAWSPSSDDTGVSKYVIVVDDTQIIDSYDFKHSILKLQPSKKYCFKVYAFDNSGNRSAASDEVCAETLAEEFAAWTMKLGCQGQNWLIEKKVDLNLDNNFDLVVTDSAHDYSGTALVYHLYGSYIVSDMALNASIRWTFENSSNVRMDEFQAVFSSDDTGDINMNQTQKTGCDAKVRFIKNVIPAKSSYTGPKLSVGSLGN